MVNGRGVTTIVVPWRKFCATLPAVALMSAGIAFAAPVAPGRDISSVAVSSDSAAIVVPETALTMPAVIAPSWTDPFAMAAPQAPAPPGGSAPALVPSEGTPFGSSAAVAIDSSGVPVRALEAYRAAALLVGAADPGCHIDWALLAAFGRVESNHARFGGNQLDAAGVAQPGIYGIALDGTNGTARITDSDGGQFDRDTVYDRAVGPMQFIPGTWRTMGVDADRDGVKNPQDMADSATAAAVYVCSGPGDLSRPGDLHAAIMRYNPSSSYAATVTAIAASYRLGVSALPASDVAAATSPASTSPTVTASDPTSGPDKSAPLRATPVPPTPVPAKPVPAKPVPAKPVPAKRIPAKPVPAKPLPTKPVPTKPVPAAPIAEEPIPDPPVTTLPDPCLPVPTPTDTTLPDPCLPDPCLADPPPTDATPTDATPTEATPTVPTPTDPCLPDPCLPDPTLTPAASTPSTTPGTQETCTVAPLDSAPTPTP